MSAIQSNYGYGVWGIRTRDAAIASVGVSAAVGGFLGLYASGISAPDDWQRFLATTCITAVASAAGACTGRMIDKVEDSDNPHLKALARAVGGVVGGAGLVFSLANTVNILYTGDVMSVDLQLIFSACGAVAGGLLGGFTKGAGSCLANVGTSTSLASSLGIAASCVLPRFFKLIPVPTLLSFSSLICHPFKAKVT